MERFSETIFQEHTSRSPLTLRGSLRFEVFAAVAFLHGCAVCHRDLKPENLLLLHRSSRIEDNVLKAWLLPTDERRIQDRVIR